MKKYFVFGGVFIFSLGIKIFCDDLNALAISLQQLEQTAPKIVDATEKEEEEKVSTTSETKELVVKKEDIQQEEKYSVPLELRKKYSWIFDMLPEKYHRSLETAMKRDRHVPLFKKYDEHLQKNPLDVTLKTDKRLRRYLGILMAQSIQDQEGIQVTGDNQNPWTMVYFKFKKINTTELCKYEFKPFEDLQDLSKRKSLAGCYKIHLMPHDTDVLHVVQVLLELIKNDTKLKDNIITFKIYTRLQDLYDYKKNLLAKIVVYVTWGEGEAGKANAQYVADTLAQGLKKFKGTNMAPRYNTRYNDMIFYAQGDADNKNKYDKDIDAYFDKNTNYALYRPDFEKLNALEDFKKPYTGKDPNPYALLMP